MNFKVPSGAGSADFGGKIHNQINKMPDKNAHKVPMPPCEEHEDHHAHSQMEEHHSAGEKMGKAMTPERVHLCMAPIDSDEGPKMYQCRAEIDVYPDKSPSPLPPKVNQCAFIPDEGLPQLKPKRPLPPGIYGCRAEGKPDLKPLQPKEPGIYQCTAKIVPGKRPPDQGIYQCSFQLPGPESKNPPGIYACSFKRED
jgi:hypothetical protein